MRERKEKDRKKEKGGIKRRKEEEGREWENKEMKGETWKEGKGRERGKEQKE